MILLIDIGNSRTKYAFFHQNKLSPIRAIDNKILTQELFENEWKKATQVILTNVHQEKLTQRIDNWCKTQDISFTNVKTEKEKANVINGYSNTESLGTDRWLALLGAAKHYPNKNLLIIDAGTATTIDILAKSGLHNGGWILPGISTMLDSLSMNTSKINVKLARVNGLKLGKDTKDCVNQALWAATIGMIEQAVMLTNDTVNEIDQIIITGGNGKQIQRLLAHQTKLIPTLIFDGLLQYR